MAANLIARYPEAVFNAGNTFTLANTNKDGSGANCTLLFTAGEDGARIDSIQGVSRGSNPATVFRLFLYMTTETQYLLYRQYSCAPTVDTNVSALPILFYEKFTDFILAPGNKLYGTIGTAAPDGIDITITGGQY